MTEQTNSLSKTGINDAGDEATGDEDETADETARAEGDRQFADLVERLFTICGIDTGSSESFTATYTVKLAADAITPGDLIAAAPDDARASRYVPGDPLVEALRKFASDAYWYAEQTGDDDMKRAGFDAVLDPVVGVISAQLSIMPGLNDRALAITHKVAFTVMRNWLTRKAPRPCPCCGEFVHTAASTCAALPIIVAIIEDANENGEEPSA